MEEPMNPDSTYTVNERDVIAESLEGETLIINLKSGVYYTSNGIGDEVWRYLRDGCSVGQVIETLCARYVGDPGAIRADLLSFVSQLRTENLILDGDVLATAVAAQTRKSDGASVFTKPVLQRYTNFQELLLLDPIHEVDEPSGWPVLKPDANS
jgi:hypothetical protein